MKTWWIYDLASGLLDGRSFSISPFTAERLASEVPAGCGAIEGVTDWQSERVDVTAPAPVLVPYQPPAPADSELATWAWNSDTRRYLPTLTPEGRKPQMLAEVHRQMAEAEAAAQDRPTREMLLAVLAGSTPPAAAVERLQEIEARLLGLRTLRSAIADATTHEALDALSEQLAP